MNEPVSPTTIKVYIDYKSPYAYLAKDLIYDLERKIPARIDWLPYDLDFADKYAGVSSIDASGAVVINRSPHQWRRTKYEYMNCRREANLRVPRLIIRGTRKIWDSSLAAIGLLYAKQHGVFRAYNDRIFERFWKRELDIEDRSVLAAVLTECGADAAAFPAFLDGEGRQLRLRIQQEAEAAGVFGVPSFLFEDGDLYWGREHLPRIAELCAERAAA